MGKRLAVFLLAASMTLLLAGVSASGEEHELPEHAHILLLNAEVAFEPSLTVTYDKCVDLANNRALKLNAHHQHIHFADSGVSFGGASGNLVGPAAGFPDIPWQDCATLANFFPPND